MNLLSISSFEILNKKTIHYITGGTTYVKDSKKGDVSSTSQDSKTDDGTPSFV